MGDQSLSEMFSSLYDSSEDSREGEMEWEESLPDSHITYDIKEA